MKRVRLSVPLRRISPWVGVGLLLIPFAMAGFFFDDMHNSVTRGAGVSLSMSYLDILREHLREWLTRQGRLFPLGVVLGTTTWWIADSLVVAQTLRITFALLNVFVLYRLVQLLCPGTRLPGLVVLSLSLVIQFNPRWDGLSSFMPLNPAVMMFVLCSWWFVATAMTTISRRIRHGANVFAVIAVVCALLTYEIGVASVVGAGLITWVLRERDRHFALRLGISMLIIAVAFATAYLAVRLGAQGGYDGIQTGSLSKAPLTLLSQAGSAFPLAFFNNSVLGTARIEAGLWILLFLLFFICWALLFVGSQASEPEHTAQVPDRNGQGLLIALGCLLVILPAGIISVSGKYQQIITYGDPYIVVYMQYFGAALLLGTLLDRLSPQLRESRMRWTLCIIVACISSMTVAVNITRVKLKNEAFKLPRSQMERLVHAGFLKNVAPGTLLIVDSVHPWEAEGAPPRGLCSYFFSHHQGRPVRCMGYQAIVDGAGNTPGWNGAPTMLLRRSRESDGRDRFTLQGAGELLTATINDGQVEFTRSPDSRPMIFTWLGSGFYDWEPPGRQEFVWARSQAQVSFWNPQEEPVNVMVRLTLQSAVMQQIKGHLGMQTVFTRPALAGEDLTLEFEMPLNSGLSVLELRGDGVPATPNGDPRALSFRLLRMNVTPS